MSQPQAWSEVGGLISQGQGDPAGCGMDHHTGQTWDIAFKVRGCLDGRVPPCQGTVSVKLERPCDTMPLEFAGGFSLLPPLLWLWVRGFILTSGRSQRDDSGAMTGSPHTRSGPGSLGPLRATRSGPRALGSMGAGQEQDS